MFHDAELITLVSGLIVLVYFFWNRRVLKKVQHVTLLISTYCCFLAGWFATVMESFWYPNFFNLVEHSSYAIGGILLASWAILTIKSDRRQG